MVSLLISVGNRRFVHLLEFESSSILPYSTLGKFIESILGVVKSRRVGCGANGVALHIPSVELGEFLLLRLRISRVCCDLSLQRMSLDVSLRERERKVCGCAWFL